MCDKSVMIGTHTYTKTCSQHQLNIWSIIIFSKCSRQNLFGQLRPLQATGEQHKVWEWMDWLTGKQKKKEGVLRLWLLKERGGFERERECRSLGDERKRRRRGIPPTKPVVVRFWGLDCSQETVVAPSQASHRAALGHPVIDRQTYQMAWLGQLTRICLFFILWWWGEIVQHKLFIRPLICHVSAFACGECVYISPACV